MEKYEQNYDNLNSSSDDEYLNINLSKGVYVSSVGLDYKEHADNLRIEKCDSLMFVFTKEQICKSEKLKKCLENKNKMSEKEKNDLYKKNLFYANRKYQKKYNHNFDAFANDFFGINDSQNYVENLNENETIFPGNFFVSVKCDNKIKYTEPTPLVKISYKNSENPLVFDYFVIINKSYPVFDDPLDASFANLFDNKEKLKEANDFMNYLDNKECDIALYYIDPYSSESKEPEQIFKVEKVIIHRKTQEPLTCLNYRLAFIFNDIF